MSKMNWGSALQKVNLCHLNVMPLYCINFYMLPIIRHSFVVRIDRPVYYNTNTL